MMSLEALVALYVYIVVDGNLSPASSPAHMHTENLHDYVMSGWTHPLIVSRTILLL